LRWLRSRTFLPSPSKAIPRSRLGREIVKVFDDPKLRQQMAGAGMDPWLGGPTEMAKLLRSEMAHR
jgi:hypothetical protein